MNLGGIRLYVETVRNIRGSLWYYALILNIILVRRLQKPRKGRHCASPLALRWQVSRFLPDDEGAEKHDN